MELKKQNVLIKELEQKLNKSDQVFETYKAQVDELGSELANETQKRKQAESEADQLIALINQLKQSAAETNKSHSDEADKIAQGMSALTDSMNVLKEKFMDKEQEAMELTQERNTLQQTLDASNAQNES